MGIKTIGELDRFLRNNVENAYQLALHQIGGTDLDIISSNIGIQNLCIVHILKQGRGLEGLEWFYDQLYGKQPRNAQRARRTLQQAKKLAIIKEEK